MRIVEAAGFILVYPQDDGTPLYLLLQYRDNHWGFPKGKIDPGETKEQAAFRELEEETGLKSAAIFPNFLGNVSYSFIDYDHVETHKTAFYFLAQADSKTIKLSHEHKNYIWLPYAQALEKLTHDNTQTVLTQAHTYFIREGISLL